jgi:hypothetical protein
MTKLDLLYRAAAAAAYKDGVSAGDPAALREWIESHCSYNADQMFFLVLGIGTELADIEAQAQGYDNEVHRAFESAKRKVSHV